jgi:hypothetical protein
MDDDAILLALGKLQGQMDGIGREIGDLKKMIGNEPGGLCSRVTYLETNGAKISQKNAEDIVVLQEHVEHLEKHQSSNQQVSLARAHWIDSVWAKAGMVITIILTVVNFIRGSTPL